MTLNGGTTSSTSTQACAACKYQRRKCTSECPLAPYFPADQPKTFQNAHRLFGVSNILKILKQIDPAKKSDAMHSIISEANIRALYPITGCLGLVRYHLSHIRHVEEQLIAVRAQIDLYRHFPNTATTTPDAFITASPFDHTSNPTHYMDDPSLHLNQLIHQQYANDDPTALQMSPREVEVHEFDDDLHPCFDTIDDRQSYIHCNDPYESSPESSLKDATQSVDHENELKNVERRCLLQLRMS